MTLGLKQKSTLFLLLSKDRIYSQIPFDFRLCRIILHLNSTNKQKSEAPKGLRKVFFEEKIHLLNQKQNNHVHTLKF